MAMRPAGRGRPTPRGRCITARYLGILAAEGVIGLRDVDLAPRIALTDAEPAEGERTLGPECRPVVLVPSAGMASRSGRTGASWRRRLRAARSWSASSGCSTRGAAARHGCCRRRCTCARRRPCSRCGTARRRRRRPGHRARCGWRPRSAPAPWGSSARRWPRATGWARAATTGRACPAARNAARPPSPSRCAGGTPGARCPRPARPAWPTSPRGPSSTWCGAARHRMGGAGRYGRDARAAVMISMPIVVPISRCTTAFASARTIESSVTSGIATATAVASPTIHDR